CLQFRIQDLEVDNLSFDGVVILIGDLDNACSFVGGQGSEELQLVSQNRELVGGFFHHEHFPDISLGERMMQDRKTEYVVKRASKAEVWKHAHSVADVQAFLRCKEARAQETSHTAVDAEHWSRASFGGLLAKESFRAADVDDRFPLQIGRHLHGFPLPGTETLMVNNL